MRKIKFRGKRKNGHEMLIGDLNYISNGVFIFPRDGNSPLNSPDWFEVVPETVGQFTGLHDKEGKEIWEGDVFKEMNGRGMLFRVSAVKGGFAINVPVERFQKDIQMDYPFPLQPLADEQTVSWIKGSCVVIGNIHDNPELLKQ